MQQRERGKGERYEQQKWRKWHVSRWTIHRENCRFDIWWFVAYIRGWLLKEFHIWRQVCHHWKQLFWRKISAALKASCTSLLLHTHTKICRNIVLNWHWFVSSFKTWSVFELKNCWLPSIIWGADFVLWDFHSWKFSWIICISCWITL